jgi:hypothetical protein
MLAQFIQLLETLLETQLRLNAGTVLFLLVLLILFFRFLDWRQSTLQSEANKRTWLHPGALVAPWAVFLGLLSIALWFVLVEHPRRRELGLNGIKYLWRLELGLNVGSALLCFLFLVLVVWLWDWRLEKSQFKTINRDWFSNKLDEWFPENKLDWNLPSAALTFLLLIAVLSFLEWFHFIPSSGGSIKLNAVEGTGIEITYETSKGHSESATVISVPAYRMATPTQITLHPGDTVEISASGIISTDSSYNWFGGMRHPTNLPYADWLAHLTAPEVYTNLEGEMSRSGFNRNAVPNWRDPQGNRLSTLSDTDFSADEPLQKAHDEQKLLPNGKYGLLMGCVVTDAGPHVDNLQLIAEVLSERTHERIFPIGQSQVIQCLQDERDQMRLHFPPSDDGKPKIKDILLPGVEGQIVLLVNDVVVSESGLDHIMKTAIAAVTNTNVFVDTNLFKLSQSIFSESNEFHKLDSNHFNLFAQELWYWDNLGIFTVVIKKTE